MGDRYDSWGKPPPAPGHHNPPPPSASSTTPSMPPTALLGAARRASLIEPGNNIAPAADGSSTGTPPDEQPPAKRRRDSSNQQSAMDDRPMAITCTTCRARKIKCDSAKPTCRNCHKAPELCHYPLKLKPGLRPGTGSDLQRRIDMLEERVQAYESQIMDHENRLSQLNQWQQTNAASAPPMNALPLSTPMSTMAPPQSFPTTIGSGGDGAPSIGMSFSPADLPGSAGTLDLGSFNTNQSPGGGSVASFLDTQLLPADDIVRDLIGLFFTHIAPWAPILSPSTFSQPWNPPWDIRVYAIVVVTLRFSTDPRIASTKQQIRQAAKSQVLSHAIESTSISSVQALALLALDLIGSEQGPSSWGILALLTRSAVHLGLIQEDDRHGSAGSGGGGSLSGRPPAPSLSRTSIIPPSSSWQEDESRRRLFWLIFCLDRYACVSTGWDFALPDFEINRCLPCSDELWAQNEWFTTPVFRPVLHRDAVPDRDVLSPMAYLVEALDLLGRSHTLQSRTVDPNDSREVEHRRDMTMTLTSAAKRWFSDLPFASMEPSSMTLVIQAIYHATLLKLNAYYAFPALSNGVPVEPYGSTCISSARACVALVNTARELGFMQSSSPLFIWSTWVAARVLFVSAFLAHADNPGTDFDTIVQALKEQAPIWTLANQYVRLLERAKRKWLNGTAYDGEANPTDAIRALLDLRRTAYSAVGINGQATPTPYVSPPDVNLSHLPAWAIQPLLGDLHNWFDLPAGLFQEGQ